MRATKRGFAVALAIAATAAAIASPSAVQAESQVGPSTGPLDCGDDKQGVKAAFREFTAILREGDYNSVLSALEKPRRFAWLHAGVQKPSGKVKTLIGERQRKSAAEAVWVRGGLPIEITEFFSVSEPSYWTGAGIRGTWGQRDFVGKTQLNCNKGQATVLSIAVEWNPDRSSGRSR